MKEAASKRGKSLEDLSSKTIGKAVLMESLSANPTKFSLAIGAVSALAGCLFGFSFPLLLAALGGAVIGSGSWVYHYLILGDSLKLEHIRQMQARFREETEKRRAEVCGKLCACRDIKGADGFVEQALAQFEHVQESLEGFHKVLGMKLDKGELTFSTFLVPGELVAYSAIDNLEQIVVIMESIRSIDMAYLENRLANLARTKEKSPVDLAEEQTLKDRQNIYSKQIHRARILLAQNEEGITALENTTSKMSEMDTQERFSELGLPEALAELKKIAERSQIFKKGG